MISEDDIEAFMPIPLEKDIVVTKSTTSFGKEVFRYEVFSASPDDIPEAKLVVRRLEKYPGHFYLTVTDDIIEEKLSILIPQYVWDAMIEMVGSS